MKKILEFFKKIKILVKKIIVDNFLLLALLLALIGFFLPSIPHNNKEFDIEIQIFLLFIFVVLIKIYQGTLKQQIVDNFLLLALLLALIGFSIPSIPHNNKEFDIEIQKTLLGIFVALITFYQGTLKQKIEDDKIFYDLFKEFNKRYDELNDLFNSIKKDDDETTKAEELKMIIDYFNLCSEEYLWYSKKRIDEEIWDAWFTGMKQNIEIPKVKAIFNEEKKQPKSYYGFMEYYENNRL